MPTPVRRSPSSIEYRSLSNMPPIHGPSRFFDLMKGYLALVLHAHLPYVRHPEHEKFLEENWLFEAVVETYLPLLEVFEGWLRDGMESRLTICLSPTLCAMLRDPLLHERCLRHLNGLIELADKE